MIKISAFPKCWIEDISEGRMSLFDWLEQSVQLECQGLEMYSRFLESYDLDYLAEVRSRVEELGMCIPMMCFSPDFTIPDAKERQKEIARQIELIKVTAALGGEFCRTLSGQARPEVSLDQGINWVTECIGACLETAEMCGVRLVIENHFKDGYWKYREFAQKKDVFVELVNRIESPWLGVQYDPSNAVVAGDDPIELLRRVLPRVVTMHASDRSLIEGTLDDLRREENAAEGYAKRLKHGEVGQGLNDYDTIFTLLSGQGFSSWISIEDGVEGIDQLARSVAFLQKKIAEHWPA